MTSRASFCNRTVLGRNLRRFWPVWAAWLIALVLIVAAMQTEFLRIYGSRPDASAARDWFSSLNSSHLLLLLGFFQFPYAFLCAACCFHYLHRKRSAYTLHALPLSRGVLFRSNALSGLLMGLVPMAIAALLYLLLFRRVLSYDEGASLRLLWNAAMEYLCAYGLAVLCMMVTGRTTAAVLCFGVVNLLGLTLGVLLPMLLNSLTYALDFQPMRDALLYLSPVLAFVSSNGNPLICGLYGLVLGGGLTALAALLYRRRPVERAEETFAFRGAELVFRVLFVLVGTLIFGYLLVMILDQSFSPYAHPVRCYVIFAAALVVSWLATHLIFTRSFRLKRALPLLIGMAAALTVLGAGVWALHSDILGVQSHVPETASLRSIRLQDPNEPWLKLTVSNPEQLSQLREACKRAAEETRQEKRRQENGLLDLDLDAYNAFRVEYVEKGGSTTVRRYSMNALTPFYEALRRDPEISRTCLADLHLERNRLIWVACDGVPYAGTPDLSAAARAALADCILQDAADGNLCLSFDNGDPWRLDLAFDLDERSCAIPVGPKAARTVAFLRANGITPFDFDAPAPDITVERYAFATDPNDGSRVRGTIWLKNPAAEAQTVVLCGEFGYGDDAFYGRNSTQIACTDTPEQASALTVPPGTHEFAVCFRLDMDPGEAALAPRLTLVPAR